MINKYPYTDFHELNLDWILREIRGLEHSMSEFEAMNKITFDGAWDITKQYPAWCIVNDNGAGYISIQPVPAGMVLTNPDYWRGVVDYTATIADLQNRVVTLEGQMSNAQGDITTLQGNVISINNRIDHLNDKKFIFIADSYAGTSGYVTRLNTLLGLTDGVDSFCNAVGGEGFTKGTDGNGFLYELQEHYAAITDPESITDIYIIGGANDAEDNQDYNTNTILSGFEAVQNYAAANFPNAKITVGFIGFCHYDSITLDNRTQRNLERMLFRYMDTALSHGCAYINNIEYSTRWLGALTTNADGLHPNAAGGNIIANALANYILGSGANTMIQDYDLTTTDTIGSNTVDATLTMSNGRASISIGEIAGRYTGNIIGGNAKTSTRTKICNFGEIFVNKPVHALTYIFVNTANALYVADFQIYGNELSMVVMNGNTGSFTDITMSNNLLITSPVTFNFDSIAFG